MSFTRKNFPREFTFGTAAASFQIEGAKYEDGKSESIWDRFCDTPGAISDGSTGETACDHYHRYPEDITLMKDLGVDAYRLSISWPRIIPEGRGKINQAGIDFYNRILDSLIESGIEPMITLYHWDLPQVLEDAGGWSNRETAYAFEEYAEVCYNAFSPKVKNWITLNEPFCSSFLGYGIGIHAPGIKDKQRMYSSIHILNLAHGLALKKFRNGGYPGTIGTTLNLSLYKPLTDSAQDILAADRATDFQTRMYLDPVVGKGYPKRHLDAHPDIELPIEPGDMELISGKIDFLGINFYNETVVEYEKNADEEYRIYQTDLPKTAMGWDITPDGLYRLLAWLAGECPGLPIYITENGSAWHDAIEITGSGNRTVPDPDRVAYLKDHLGICEKAVQNGIPLKGYFVWSFIDNFEWSFGYSRRFGIVYCDYETLERIPKASYRYYQDFLHG